MFSKSFREKSIKASGGLNTVDFLIPVPGTELCWKIYIVCVRCWKYLSLYLYANQWKLRKELVLEECNTYFQQI